MERGLREEWIMYLNKALEIVLNIFSYPRGTTEYSNNIITNNLVATLLTNSTIT